MENSSRFVIFIAALLSAQGAAQSVDSHCYFVRWWAAKAEYIRDVANVPEERWHIIEGGYPAEIYDEIVTIKREAYNDPKALKRRLDAACGDPA
jgi:hypothetical protein